jgi:hypothetical protein
VRVTSEEEAVLQARADAAGVTVARLFSECALGNAPNPSRRVIVSELFGVRRQIQGADTNLNQLARSANSGVFVTDDQVVEVLDQWAALVDRVNVILSGLDASK